MNLRYGNDRREMTGTSHSPKPRRRTAAGLCMVLALAVAGCLDPYPPPESDAEVNFLVIDGFINSGQGLVSVKLSRALPLKSTASHPAVKGAVVRVEEDGGTTFVVTEVSPGRYESIVAGLEIGSRYRLLINTKDGQDFESDFVTLKQSPELEEISWSPDGDGITIHVDARDPSGSTRYYQWLYTETWEYDADQESGWYVRNGSAVQRTQQEKINLCYVTAESSKVLISTTSDQSGDFINDYPLVHIPRGSKKLCRHYSILVQQRALDESSYNYWLQLQRTTENLGGLFDPLPSRVIGNVRSTSDPGQRVLGYFSGGGVQEKRIYIEYSDLPEDLRFVSRSFCPLDSVSLANLNSYLNGTALAYPYGSPDPIGYMIASPQCMDCRSEGGTLTKPSFWPF